MHRHQSGNQLLGTSMTISLIQKFQNQKKHAKVRGIGFLLSFNQWLLIWKRSGHLAERGRGKGKFVMARFGDVGPYAINNVKIITCEQNASEQRPTWNGRKHTAESRKKMSMAAMGNTNGKANKGRTIPPSQIEAVRKANTGNHYRADYCRRMRQ